VSYFAIPESIPKSMCCVSCQKVTLSDIVKLVMSWHWKFFRFTNIYYDEILEIWIYVFMRRNSWEPHVTIPILRNFRVQHRYEPSSKCACMHVSMCVCMYPCHTSQFLERRTSRFQNWEILERHIYTEFYVCMYVYESMFACVHICFRVTHQTPSARGTHSDATKVCLD